MEWRRTKYEQQYCSKWTTPGEELQWERAQGTDCAQIEE